MTFGVKKIQGPLAHQADIWRIYAEKHLKSSDLAIEMPTGSGKTLVGLILAEWRRRLNKEKVVYLCPTNQLVYQVAEQSEKKYGLKVVSFTGKVNTYSAESKSEYQMAEKIAVTSYSALFNSNPYFSDPDLIILDDAHASENYISKLWSLEIENDHSNNGPLFIQICGLLKGEITESCHLRLTQKDSQTNDPFWVEKLPTPVFHKISKDLIELIDASSEGPKKYFNWSLIRDHLFACHFYMKYNRILIRPIIPPTNTHLPFFNAKQRIYMSATLGAGGDLERLTGRKIITRLPIPKTWERQGIGRRFFLFPERKLTEIESIDKTIELAKLSNRALFLVPDDSTVQSLTNLLKEKGFQIFTARDIETSKDKFVNSDKAIAVLANRYDGIDFPDEQCRFLVLMGLTTATNLQERFLVSKMGANVLLNERQITRIIQAIGRCTRSATDFSCVIAIGDEIVNFFLNAKKRKYLHPELQAELEFGINQSSEPGQFDDLLKHFLKQSDEWMDADADIISERDNCHQDKIPCVEDLNNSVKSEIQYTYNIWSGKFIDAFDSAKEVLGKLTDPELKGYRGLWNYLAGSAAWLAGKEIDEKYLNLSKEFYRASAETTMQIKWLSELADKTGAKHPLGSENGNPNDLSVVERFEHYMLKLGLQRNEKYNDELNFILENINKNDKKYFEPAHYRLGKLIGYEAGNEESNGAPDPWWIATEKYCFIFEDHSNASIESSLHVDKAMQVFTHDNWVKASLAVNENVEIVKILITPVKRADKEALFHLKDVWIWPLADFRKWVETCIIEITALRKKLTEEGDLFWRSEVFEVFRNKNILPTSILSNLKNSTNFFNDCSK